MEEEGHARLSWFDGDVALQRSADMRYGEQVFEVVVPLDDVDWAAPDLGSLLAERFHPVHEALYTYALRDQEVVVVMLACRRSAGCGGRARDRRNCVHARGAQSQRRIYLGDAVQVPVFDFPALSGQQRIAGPAIVESQYHHSAAAGR